MLKNKTRQMTAAAIFSAIVVVMTLVPYTGYILILPGLEVTTLHIPVIVAAIALGPLYGSVVGFVWGITCIIRAAALVSGMPILEVFLNPLVSVFPRVMVGFVAGFLAQRLAKRNRALSHYMSAAAGTLTNTVLVLTLFTVFSGGTAGGIVANIVAYAISLNCVVELGAAMALIPVAALAIQRANR